MSTQAIELVDFYQQLSLLTRSGLPLPESLQQLAGNTRRGELRDALLALSTATAGGVTLTAAMQQHPRLFNPFHIRMIAIGMHSDTLPAVLAEIARVARIQHRLSSMLRDILAYPLVTTTFALALFLTLCRFIIPLFGAIYDEMLPGESLPGLTNLIFSIASVVYGHFYLCIIAFVAYLGFSLWLLSDTLPARRCLLNMATIFPFANIIFYNLAMAKFCSLWGLMMKRGIPETDAFPEIARLVEHQAVAHAVTRVAEECAAGKNLYAELRREGNISRLVVLTLEHTPESRRSDELTQLAELYHERAAYGFRRLAVAWETAAVTGMATAAGLVLFLLFSPIIRATIF